MSNMQEVIKKLESVGYCRLSAIYSPSRMEEAREKVCEWYERTKNKTSDDVPFLNTGQPTLYSLETKDPFFLDLLFEPVFLQDILIHFLNDPWFKQIPPDQPNYILRALAARSSKKALPMHLDSFVPYRGSHVFMMQYSIILEDQDAANGCTVVVPGSHQSGEYKTQEAAKLALPIEARAGDVVIWDSRLWHGTTENGTDGTRWAIVATFGRWWLKQHFNVTQRLPQEIYERLTDSQKAVLGFCSIPHYDETRGIDLKRGYDSLLPEVEAYRSGS